MVHLGSLINSIGQTVPGLSLKVVSSKLFKTCLELGSISPLNAGLIQCLSMKLREILSSGMIGGTTKIRPKSYIKLIFF